MSETQVYREFEGQVTPLHPDKAARMEDGNSAHSALQIPKFEIDARTFSVQLLFDSRRSLQTVQLLLLTENRYSADGTFKDFEAKLTEKYGPINFKSDDDSLGQTALFKGALYATRGWKLSATTIKLTYSRNSTNGDRRVGIRYISKAAREQSTKGL